MSVTGTGWIVLYCVGFIIAFFGSAFLTAARTRHRRKDDALCCIMGSLVWPGTLVVLGFFALEKLWEAVHDYAFYKKRR